MSSLSVNSLPEMVVRAQTQPLLGKAQELCKILDSISCIAGTIENKLFEPTKTESCETEITPCYMESAITMIGNGIRDLRNQLDRINAKL